MLSQQIGKPNNLKVFGSKKTKGLKHQNQNGGVGVGVYGA
jgi:hypothetical protein